MHSVFCGKCPDYLANIVSFVNYGRPRCSLWSSSSSDFSLPWLRTKFGERAFTYAGLSARNSLPKDLRAVTDPELVKKRLKTHFFSLAFCVCWQFGWLCNAPMTYNCNRRTINPRMMVLMMIMRRVCDFVSDLVWPAAVWLLCLSDWLWWGEGRTVNGVWALVCIPSAWVQCPVVYTQHRSSGKSIVSWLQFPMLYTHHLS